MVQSTTAEAARPACWFMGSPFQRSLVYDRMLCAQYDYVVGIDVGHGETVAYLFRRLQAAGKNGGAAVERLRMNYEDDAKLPTLIRFTSGGSVIGRKARNAPGFFQHFKVEPAKWETKIDAEHTHQHLLEAFIGALWRQILHYQPKLAEAAAQGRVLLTAGCPASEAWASLPAMERYQELLRRATQCPMCRCCRSPPPPLWPPSSARRRPRPRSSPWRRASRCWTPAPPPWILPMYRWEKS